MDGEHLTDILMENVGEVVIGDDDKNGDYMDLAQWFRNELEDSKVYHPMIAVKNVSMEESAPITFEEPIREEMQAIEESSIIEIEEINEKVESVEGSSWKTSPLVPQHFKKKETIKIKLTKKAKMKSASPSSPNKRHSSLKKYLEDYGLKSSKKKSVEKLLSFNNKVLNSVGETLDKRANFKCKICGLLFGNEKKKLNHLQKHSSENRFHYSFECAQCGVKFHRKEEIQLHLRKIHGSPGELSCDFCNRRFKSKSSFVVHAMEHAKEQSFQCDSCHFTFKDQAACEYHKLSHRGLKVFTCNTCGKEFNSGPQLLVHERIHTGEKPYKCPICDKAFRSMNLLSGHVRVHLDNNYKCTKCPKVLSRKDSLLDHLERHKRREAMSKASRANVREMLKDLREASGVNKVEEEAKAVESILEGNRQSEKKREGMLELAREMVEVAKAKERGKKILEMEMADNNASDSSDQEPSLYLCPHCKKIVAGWGNFMKHLKKHGEKETKDQAPPLGPNTASSQPPSPPPPLKVEKLKQYGCTICQGRIFIGRVSFVQHMKMHEIEMAKKREEDWKRQVESGATKRNNVTRSVQYTGNERSTSMEGNEQPELTESEEVVMDSIQDTGMTAVQMDHMYSSQEKSGTGGPSLRDLCNKDSNESAAAKSAEEEEIIMAKTVGKKDNDDDKSVKRATGRSRAKRKEDGGRRCEVRRKEDAAVAKGYYCPKCEDRLFVGEKALLEHLGRHMLREMHEARLKLQPNGVRELPPLLKVVDRKMDAELWKMNDKVWTKNNSDPPIIAPFWCLYCASNLESRSKYIAHARDHVQNGTFRCKECGIAFITQKHAKQHARVAHDSTAEKVHLVDSSNHLQCPNCPDYFVNFPDFKEHAKCHAMERYFQCCKCGVEFFEEEALAVHSKKPQCATFQCQGCPSSFHLRDDFRRHLYRKHMNGYECGDCDDFLWGRKEYEAHVKEHERRCRYCGREYAFGLPLKNHQMECYKNRGGVIVRIFCHFCKIPFASERDLREHVKCHYPQSNGKGQPSFECLICGANLKTEKKVKQHKLLHEANNGLRCDFCCKMCPDPKMMEKHAEEHRAKVGGTDGSGRSCYYCGKKEEFQTGNQLYMHLVQTHAENVFPCCVLCCQEFSDWAKLSEHFAEHKNV